MEDWFGLFGFYGTSTVVGYLMPNPFSYKWTVQYQKQFYFKQFSLALHSLNIKTVLFQVIQFSINTVLFYLTHRLDPIRCDHSGQSVPGSDGNEGVVHIPESSSITGTLPSDCLVSYPGHLLVGGGVSYPSAVVQSVYSTAPAPTGQEWRIEQKTKRRLFNCLC